MGVIVAAIGRTDTRLRPTKRPKGKNLRSTSLPKGRELGPATLERFDDAGGRNAVDDFRYADATTVFFDDFVADDLVFGVVSAFDEHLWPNCME